MIAAEVEKAAVVEKQGKTYLMAVVKYDRDYLNIQIEYDWRHLDHKQFEEDLIEAVAKGLDISTKRVQINFRSLYDKMREYSLWQMGIVV